MVLLQILRITIKLKFCKKVNVNKIIFGLLLVLSLIFCQKTFCQRINYLEIQSKVNTLTCITFSPENVNSTLRKLYTLKNSTINRGFAEYCLDFGVALQFYGIINQSKMATLISNKYLYKCIHNSSTLKGVAYEYIAVNFYTINDCEKAKESIRLHKKYTLKEYWNNDLIEMVNERCK